MKSRIALIMLLGSIIAGCVGGRSAALPTGFYGTWYVDGQEYTCSCDPVLPTPTPTDTATPTATPTPIPPSKLYGYASYRRAGNLPLGEISQYSNLLYLYHSLNTGSPTRGELQALRDAGIKVILKLNSRVVEDAWDEAALLDLKARIDPYQDVIAALAVIDEPYKPAKRWTPEQLEALIDKAKAVFPEYTIFCNFLAPSYTERATGETWPTIPDNIDWVSMDVYLHLNEVGMDEYMAKLKANFDILADRAKGRPLFWFAPAFGEQEVPITYPTAEQAWLDYDLSIEYGVQGLIWYFHEEAVTIRAGDRILYFWGATHFPDLLATHQEIGEAFLNEQSPIPTATPTDTPTSTPTATPTSTPIPTRTPSPSRQKTITIIIDLMDASVPCSTEAIHDSVYGPVNSTHSTYLESSRGELDIYGETARVTVPFSKAQFEGQCGVEQRMLMANAAHEILIQQGYNLDGLWRQFYVLPVCYGGTFIRGYYIFSSECAKPKLLAHELGHTMGRVGNKMYHASTPTDDYGDYSCVMGGMRGFPGTAWSAVPQFNAPHRIALGWADYVNVTESGQYTLVATERDDHVILRVPKDAKQAYYLSFRAPIGEDVDLEAEYLSRVSVHTFLSDPLANGDQHSWLLATLGGGDSFSGLGMAVSCLSVDGETATVQITLP